MKHKTRKIEELDLGKLLDEAKGTDALFLTRKGSVRYVLMPADDGDQEAWSLRNNADFMAYLDECRKRAKTGPRYSLDEVKAHFGIETAKSPPHSNGHNGRRLRSGRRGTGK